VAKHGAPFELVPAVLPDALEGEGRQLNDAM